jgi:hypothetical protein
VGIGAAPVGTFLRGEIVTQDTSGAMGELLGYVLNSAGTSGWMVMLTQAGVFDASHIIRGGTSGAYVTATSYNLVRRQIVIAKDTSVIKGWLFYEALMDTEIAASSNTALFSDLATNAPNCSTTVAPGNSSSVNNLFPAYGIACIGQAQSTANVWFDNSGTWGKAHMAAVSATPSAAGSADGSFFIAQYSVSDSGYEWWGLQRLDDTEPGDVDPFIWSGYTTDTFALTSRMTATSAHTEGWTYRYLGNYINARGYCARCTGVIGTVPDSFVPFEHGCAVVTGSTPLLSPVVTYAPKVRNHPDNLTGGSGAPPLPFEPFVISTNVAANVTMVKGRTRWYGMIPAGSQNDTADGKQWLCVLAANGATNPAVYVGPLDGSTTPLTQ